MSCQTPPPTGQGRSGFRSLCSSSHPQPEGAALPVQVSPAEPPDQVPAAAEAWYHPRVFAGVSKAAVSVCSVLAGSCWPRVTLKKRPRKLKLLSVILNSPCRAICAPPGADLVDRKPKKKDQNNSYQELNPTVPLSGGWEYSSCIQEHSHSAPQKSFKPHQHRGQPETHPVFSRICIQPQARAVLLRNWGLPTPSSAGDREGTRKIHPKKGSQRCWL